MGVIIRTVAEGKSEELINNDFSSLIDKWKKLQSKSKRTKEASLIYEDLETASSVIRDLFTPDIGKIVIDSKKLYRKLSKLLKKY